MALLPDGKQYRRRAMLIELEVDGERQARRLSGFDRAIVGAARVGAAPLVGADGLGGQN